MFKAYVGGEKRPGAGRESRGGNTLLGAGTSCLGLDLWLKRAGKIHGKGRGMRPGAGPQDQEFD